jgi:hypothetical protein
MNISYNAWYESIQAIQLKPSAAKIDQCPGAGFRKPDDGRHYFIMVSDLTPDICYYCGKKEGK